MAAHVAHLQAAQAMQLAQARAAGLIPQGLQLPGEYQAPTSLYLIWTKTVYGFVPDVVSCVL